MRYTIQTLPQTLEKEDFVLFFDNIPHNPVTKSCLSQWYECDFYVSDLERTQGQNRH